MARQSSLGGRLKKIKRKYKHISPRRFLYNDKQALKQRYKFIKVWFLIHDEKLGYSIMLTTFRRKKSFSVRQWSKAFSLPDIVGTKALFVIYTVDILPAINNKGGNHWRFKSVIGWTGDTPKIDNPNISTKPNKVKARNG